MFAHLRTLSRWLPTRPRVAFNYGTVGGRATVPPILQPTTHRPSRQSWFGSTQKKDPFLSALIAVMIKRRSNETHLPSGRPRPGVASWHAPALFFTDGEKKNQAKPLPLNWHSTAVSSEAWAKLRDWASVAGRGRLLLSGSVAHASLKTAVPF